MIVNIGKVRGIITPYRQIDFHIKRVKPQFSDLTVLNITLYIVLVMYEHICGVDTHAFT